MGKLINGINGSFSGKAGNVVGSSWMGKSYVKSIPAAPAGAPSRKASENQTPNRQDLLWLSGS